MLEVIDSSGLTDSLRDRVPRLIPVEYADIDDVFEIVSSVYAPEMQAPGGRGGGGDPRQALAAMMGGRRGGGDDENGGAQSAEPQVTLGVDRDTSHLIVSASDATFAEIEELVYSVDEASKSARRSVMVRQLVNTNASMVQDSLTSIIPKVSVSTSSSSSRPSTSNSSSGSSTPSPPSGGDAEAMQRRMEFFQRMREQGGGGGFGGGGDRGGRGGGGGGDRGGRGGGGRGR